MIQPIMKDPDFLSIPSKPATKFDIKIAQDLKDTLTFYSDRCVGMAANMIGVSKNIIVFTIGPIQVVMFNPKITKKSKPYKTEEGCLSLVGQGLVRDMKKLQSNIKMRVLNQKFNLMRDLLLKSSNMR